MNVSILIPAHNEAGNLQPLLDEIAAAMRNHRGGYEVLVIDDGSSDESWAMLLERAGNDPTLRPIHHDESAGQSTAIWQAAHLARGRWLATLDGDGQNDPADLPRLLDHAARHDLALVTGYRTRRRDSRMKRLSSRIANGVRARLLRDQTPDTGCGLKVIDRAVFLGLPYFDHMHRFLPALVQSQGGRCASVPVNHRARQRGRSHYGLNDRLWPGIVDLFGVMWLIHRSRLPAAIEEADRDIDRRRSA